MVAAAGQPLITDDLWWHLALGRAYAAQGPWLAEDPLLFTAPGPPMPAAWLWDLGLHGAERLSGFHGLRALHAALVLGLLGATFALLRRSSRSTPMAAAGVAAVVVLSSYRLAQLRPHLATLLAALALYALLLARGQVPSWRRVGLAALLLGLWANLHPGFPIGLLMLGGAAGGLVAAAPLREPGDRALDRRRAARLVVALLLGLLATLATPSGLDAHLAWFVAGSDTPSLARVADEWAGVALFRWPVPTLPPSLLAWLVLWLILIATPLAAWGAARSWRGGEPSQGADPALVALALGVLPAPLLAVRFLWLGFFPVLLLATVAGAWLARSGAPARRRSAWAAAALLVALVPGFLRYGDWPMVSRGLPRTAAGWKVPYAPATYYGHSAWLLADAGITGRAYNDYATGGFLGYWLAPELRTFLNGTLNVTPEIAQANLPIRERRGMREGESFLALLDRLGIDVFIGIHLPQVPPGRRPWYRTTSHLEDAPGWVLAFRNLRSAVYLRSTEQNAENLERIAAYYAERGVPFAPGAGFDPARVLREAPEWALRHGLAPRHYPQLGSLSLTLDASGDWAIDELAAIFASLGEYERAAAAARRRLGRGASPAAQRTLVWSLLQLERGDEAREAARALASLPGAGALDRAVAEASEHLATLDADEAAAIKARLPVLTLREAVVLLSRTAQARPRPPRTLDPP